MIFQWHLLPIKILKRNKQKRKHITFQLFVLCTCHELILKLKFEKKNVSSLHYSFLTLNISNIYITFSFLLEHPILTSEQLLVPAFILLLIEMCIINRPDISVISTCLKIPKSMFISSCKKKNHTPLAVKSLHLSVSSILYLPTPMGLRTRNRNSDASAMGISV